MKYFKLIITSFLLLGFITQAQKAVLRKALNDYDNFSYIKTTKVLERVAINGYSSPELFEKLGNAYYFNNDMESASKWYKKLMELDKPVDSEYIWRYAQALKGTGNYKESDQLMARFNEINPEDLRSKAFTSKVDYLARIEKVSREDIKIHNLDLNTYLSDFGTTQYKNQLIFASNRGGGNTYKWNDQPYLDLYSATKNEEGEYNDIEKLNENINTRFHESSAAYTPDDKFMFFSRNNYFKKRYKEDSNNTNRLQLYRANKNDKGNWDKISSIHFNSNDYSVAHPSINVQGDLIYFASDMPGTVGDSDIFVAEIKKDGTLGVPTNLGVLINTQGRESFPYINERGDLYFSSNGYPGLGGLDVFIVKDFEKKFRNKTLNYVVENKGKPINSKYDDFGYYENLTTKEGFFTSNRPGGKGEDDIYSFTVVEPIIKPEPCIQLVSGIVKDKKSGELLPNSNVVLIDNSGNLIAKTISDDNAAFSFSDIDCDSKFLVRASKEDYIGDEKRFTTPKTKQKLTLELLLENDVQKFKVGDDLAKILNIPIIYFDFNKYDIRYDAEIELQKVLAVMNEYPTMVVDIRSHTDCRAPKAYNMKLSDNRAKSTRKYLISKGISNDRLTALGYGESELVNNCACEPTNKSNCSEEEHQLNRRSEFIIIKI